MKRGLHLGVASEFCTKVFKIFHNYKNVCMFSDTESCLRLLTK